MEVCHVNSSNQFPRRAVIRNGETASQDGAGFGGISEQNDGSTYAAFASEISVSELL
jgi:hypothetical protein